MMSTTTCLGARARPAAAAVADAARCTRRRTTACERARAPASAGAASAAAAIAVVAASPAQQQPRWSPRAAPRTAAAAAAAAAASANPTTTTTPSPERLGVVIVDHGSRRAASNDALVAFCDVYRALQQRRATKGGGSDGDPESSSSDSSDSSDGEEATPTPTSIVVAVEPAHMELAEPTVEQAVGRCAAAGAHRVVVAPFFLSRGRHIQDDIPELVAGARAAHPGVEVAVAEPLGADMEGLARILLNNVEAAAGGGGAGGERGA